MNILLIYEKKISGVNTIGKLIEKKINNKIKITSFHTTENYIDFLIDKKSLISHLFIESFLYRFVIFLDILKINILSKKINIIHCVNEISSPIGYYFKKKKSIKFVITIHANYSKYLYKKKFHKIAFDNSDKIISVSNFTKEYFLKFANLRDKVTTLITGVDTDIFYKLRDVKKENQIIFVGPIEKERKGFEFLLKVIEMYRKNNFKLIIVSNSYQQDLRYKKLISRLNKTSINYKIYKNLDFITLNEIYNKSKINFASCSDYDDMYFEGFNLTILESYSAGTKSIVSTNTATEEALTFADGYAIKFGDFKALNNLIDKMLLDKYLPKKINSNIRKHSEFLLDLFKIYREL